ncbi:MAG: triphosphoribosyl-dephospho-CoA synthase [Burkholderiales bacterium]|nr:triphosphoribosyl-dephospho-CoA synthase [Burkholderiales bacterium]
METGLEPSFVAAALYDACIAELAALKPGNVGLHGEGHGMLVDEFVRSAAAIKGPISSRDAAVGQRIFNAVLATREVVSCNTNLGIVLLCAPLAHAALLSKSGQTLRDALRSTLRELTVGDAEQAFRAIRLANPGGLGEAARYDVRNADPMPQVTLQDAMREAAARDSIARQYANGFTEVFEIGATSLRDALNRGWTEAWATSACYLHLLALFADTHIARKSGIAAARRVSVRAQMLDASVRRASDPQSLYSELAAWDFELKRDGLNPGATADLTVASLFVVKLAQGRADTLNVSEDSD